MLAAPGAAVAVLDTGIDLAHPELNAVDGADCIDAAPALDDNGHGTHVAGIIGARNNGTGLAGAVPGTKLYAVKVLNSSGQGSFSSVICGIDWVTANAAALGIRVANMSLGGPGTATSTCGATADPLRQAICASTAAGVSYAVAAGNGDASGVPQNVATRIPAAYPEVLTVTAMSDSDGLSGGIGVHPACRPAEADDWVASFSNYATGAETQHLIAAPGVCILSTYPGGGYATLSGTSMATAYATGAMVLCLGSAGDPGPCAGLDAAGVIARLRTDAANAPGAPGFGSPSTRDYGNLLRAVPYRTRARSR